MISTYFAAALKCDLSFNPESRLGRLYPGLYQGLGIQANTLFTNSLLGNPVSIYVYQGAPIVNISRKLSFNYEWKFGAAIGWKNYRHTPESYNHAITTPVTAHMAVAFRFKYRLSRRWSIAAGIEATHFSNGNTQFPNGGINNIGLSLGASYTINPQQKAERPTPEMTEEADKARWIFDIIGYGAWRRRTYILSDGYDYLLPGKFGVAGLQFSPMRQFNRWIAAGVSLDAHYDESAGLPLLGGRNRRRHNEIPPSTLRQATLCRDSGKCRVHNADFCNKRRCRSRHAFPRRQQQILSAADTQGICKPSHLPQRRLPPRRLQAAPEPHARRRLPLLNPQFPGI